LWSPYYPNVMYFSSNAGVSWTQATGYSSGDTFSSLSSSADGSRFVVSTGGNGVIYVSTNGGVSW